MPLWTQGRVWGAKGENGWFSWVLRWMCRPGLRLGFRCGRADLWLCGTTLGTCVNFCSYCSLILPVLHSLFDSGKPLSVFPETAGKPLSTRGGTQGNRYFPN